MGDVPRLATVSKSMPKAVIKILQRKTLTRIFK